jgi:hypothetical protein
VPALAHVARTSPLGNGITLSNAPLTQSISFGRHSLRGDLPPGWDVELYVNEALVGYQQSRADGRYAFDDVPLIYGPNEFRLVFHGPQGETRVERQNPAARSVSAAAGAVCLPACGARRRAQRSACDRAVRLGADAPDLADGGPGQPAAGRGAPHRYANLGLRAQWQPFFVTGDIVRSGSGSLAELALRGRLGGLRLGLSRVGLTKGFISEEFLPAVDGIKFRDRVRLDGIVPVHPALNVPITLEAKRDELRLRYQNQDRVRSTTGATQLSSRIAALGVRGGIGYELSGGRRVTEGSLAIDHRLAQGLLLTGSVAHSLASAQTRYSLGFTKGVGAYGLRVAAGRDQPRRAVARRDGARAARGHLALRRAADGRQRRRLGACFPRPQPQRDRRRRRSSLARRRLHGRRRQASGAHERPRHRAPVPPADAPACRCRARRLEPMEDPQWASRQKGVRLVPRPGKSRSLDFPVIATGEIDGTVVVVDGAQKRGIGGIELELVDLQRRVVARATTASDGFYIVEAVPPGTYQLRIPRAQLRPLGLIDTGMRIVTMSAEGNFINAVDMDLIADWERTASTHRR